MYDCVTDVHVLISEVDVRGNGFGESPCSQTDTADTEIAVTGVIHLLCLS